ncbi:unnamed protein product [Protopolystoma xenopodis]|uniref:Uncharacterized protein n=1 Tax=Protopolystoma xenopodis TaxID=117903 RepID=A0A3S5AND4_9PLAT|nr:unnamed protein product [Protopolystoma xenopodis]
MGCLPTFCLTLTVYASNAVRHPPPEIYYSFHLPNYPPFPNPTFLLIGITITPFSAAHAQTTSGYESSSENPGHQTVVQASPLTSIALASSLSTSPAQCHPSTPLVCSASFGTSCRQSEMTWPSQVPVIAEPLNAHQMPLLLPPQWYCSSSMIERTPVGRLANGPALWPRSWADVGEKIQMEQQMQPDLLEEARRAEVGNNRVGDRGPDCQLVQSEGKLAVLCNQLHRILEQSTRCTGWLGP